jgi:serine/threonine protein kinase
VDTACLRFEAAWKEGKRPRLEDFLGDVAGRERDVLLRELLALELTYQGLQGKLPTLEEYGQRFPNDAVLVEAVFTKIRRASTCLPAISQGPMIDKPWTAPDMPEEQPPTADVSLGYVVVTSDGRVNSRAPSDESAGQGTAFAPGQVLQDRYVLVKELGQGGMGEVFLGRDRRLDRPVAVKIIRPLLGDGPDKGQYEQAFAEEARLGANLTHPAIATVFDFGCHQGRPFTVFEYIPGETLGELLRRRGRLPLEEVRLIIGPLAQALDFAHGRHIVHRDLKPANIRATAQGQFKILDLGLAKEFRRQSDWDFAGTPAYATPEQAANLPCDGRTDQYALAHVAFELLTGRRLFEDRHVPILLRKHRSLNPPSPGQFVPGLPDAVSAALERALRKDPDQRFPSCEDFAVALGCEFLSAPLVAAEVLLETTVWGISGAYASNPFGLGKRAPILLVLTADALWASHRSDVIRWPLRAVEELYISQCHLHLELGGTRDTLEQRISFFGWRECRAWHDQVDALRKQLGPRESKAETEPGIQPLVLLRHRPPSRFQLLGTVEATGRNRWRAEAGLQIRAAILGADAVLDVQEERLMSFRETHHRLVGTAVRSVDAEGRAELRSRWFGQQVVRISGWMLLLLSFSWVYDALYACLLTLLIQGIALQQVGRTPTVQLVLTVVGVVTLLHAGPVAVVGLLRWLRWPQLVRPTGLLVFVFGSRKLAVVVGFLLGALSFIGTPLYQAARIHYVDPVSFLVFTVELALFLFAWSLCRRAWQVEKEYRRLVPDAERRPPPSRRAVVSITLIAVILLGASLIGLHVLAGYSVLHFFKR